jgi:chaperonin GroEL (HSP60 family)
MEISKYLRQHARTIAGKSQFFVNSFAKALEVYHPVILISIQIILNLFSIVYNLIEEASEICP